MARRRRKSGGSRKDSYLKIIDYGVVAEAYLVTREGARFLGAIRKPSGSIRKILPSIARKAKARARRKLGVSLRNIPIVYAKPSYRQVGASDRRRDMVMKALPPGWRISRSGRVYYENRKNRSDIGRL